MIFDIIIMAIGWLYCNFLLKIYHWKMPILKVIDYSASLKKMSLYIYTVLLWAGVGYAGYFIVIGAVLVFKTFNPTYAERPIPLIVLLTDVIAFLVFYILLWGRSAKWNPPNQKY